MRVSVDARYVCDACVCACNCHASVTRRTLRICYVDNEKGCLARPLSICTAIFIFAE